MVVVHICFRAFPWAFVSWYWVGGQCFVVVFHLFFVGHIISHISVSRILCFVQRIGYHEFSTLAR